MSILSQGKKEQHEIQKVSHPLYKRNQEFKKIYCFGIAVLAMGNMKVIAEAQGHFDTFLSKIGLEAKDKGDIISCINDHFAETIQKVFETITTKRDQYCFVADLFRIADVTMWGQEYSESILEYYMQVFHFYPAEKTFFQSFSRAAHSQNVSAGREAYKRLLAQGFDMWYRVMIYMFPGFSLKEYYHDIHIEAGKTLLIEKPAEIDGDVIVERGGSLLIKGSELLMKGSITVNGGRIQIKNASVEIAACNQKVWLTLNRVAVVKIEDSTIDCGRQCGLLEQDSGRLLLTNTVIRNVDNARCVDFLGQSSKILNCSFYDMKEGAIRISKTAQVKLKGCEFVNMYAAYGGGIYSDSMESVKVEECFFKNCTAKYFGAAIYFKYQKFGQMVNRSECKGCVPEDSEIFNSYMDDTGIMLE